jgi:WD40 repeat protein
MPSESRIQELLLVWEELHEQGKAPTPEELCRDCPELVEPLRQQVAALRAFDPLLADRTVSAPTDPGESPGLAPGRGSPPAVPGYEILGELGRGGMGVVYKARQTSLKRPVALKMILAGSAAGAQELARFRAEAEAVARLQHPNIVQVHEVGEQNGQPYFSLEFVNGGSLAERLAGKPLSPREAAQLVQTLARAMHYAHQQGIVHRDLKPANILLASGGREPPESAERLLSGGSRPPLPEFVPKITDFGLAKRVHVEEGLTQTGYVLGTPSYMAPEQAEGRHRDVGPGADLYSLGAILYQLLTGRPPFTSSTALGTLRQVLWDEPVPPSWLVAGIPRDLETVCLKCLEKAPARRYGSAQDLAEELGRFLAGRPVRARPVGALGRLTRWARRNPAVAASGGLAAALLVGLTVVSLLFAWRERRHADDLRTALAAERESRYRADYRLAESYRDRGQQRFREGEVNQGILWLARALEAAPDGAGPLRRSLRTSLAGWRFRASSLRAVLPHGDSVQAVALSPNGRTCLTGGLDWTARLWDTATGKPLGPPLRRSGGVNAAAFSPDGKRFLLGGWAKGKGAARLWDVATGRPAGPELAHPRTVWAVAFDPCGQTVLTGGDDGAARLWDPVTGKPRGEPLRHPGPVTAVAFDPRGNTLLTWSQKTVYRWGESSTRPAATPLPLDSDALAVAFHPERGLVLTGTVSGKAQVWDLTTGKPVGQSFPHSTGVWAVAFRPDGRACATASMDQTARVWDLATGRAAGPSQHHPDYVKAVALAPDGQVLATGCRDGFARLWGTPASALPGRRTLSHPGTVGGVDFSADGKLALTRCVDGSVRLWEVATRRLKGRLRHPGPVTAAVFSPDGRTVLTAAKMEARLWEVATGRLQGRPLVHPGWVSRVAFSRGGKFLLTAGGDGTVCRWEGATGRLLGRQVLPHLALWPPLFSPDGETVLTCPRGGFGGAGEGRLWRVDSGRPVGPPLRHQDSLQTAAFSPDGRSCVTGGRDKVAQVWDVATGRSLGPPLPHSGPVTAAAFSPDGKTLVTASSPGSARLWDIATGRPLGAPLTHDGVIYALAFRPDGQAVLAGSYGGTARLWDVATGHLLGPELRHGGKIEAVAFSPDGRVALTAGWDRTAQLWAFPPPLAGPPARLRRWAEVLTGAELDKAGAGQALPAAFWAKRRAEFTEVGGCLMP